MIEEKFLGNWEATIGRNTARVTLSKNGKFNGVLYTDGNLVWTYSGRWEISGSAFTWRYEKSSPPMDNRVDINQVQSIDENTFVLRESDGEISKYHKI